MEMEKYLTMDHNELYEDLVSKVMSDPAGGRVLVEELRNTNEYQEDFIFRATIDTVQMLVLVIYGEAQKIFAPCLELVDRLTALGLWKLLSMCWNLMGTGYLGFENLERAMECYRNVIKVESQHGLKAMTSIAYNNLAVIYIILEQFEKGYVYAQKAIDSLEEVGKDQPRYESKKLKYLGELLITLCFTGRIEETEKALEEMKELNRISPNLRGHYAYHFNRMIYLFHINDYENAKEEFYEAQRQILEADINERIRLLISFMRMCQLFKLPSDFYGKELQEMESIEDSPIPQRDAEVYGLLREYYEEIGDREKNFHFGLKYTHATMLYQKELRKRHVDALDLLDDLITNSENVEVMESKNKELSLIAEEAVRNKNALQEAYSRIEMINELGKDMTSSLDLSKVIDKIYRNLAANMPLTIFILMVAEREKNQLRSIAYYHENELQKEFTISLENKGSITIECMKTGKIILSDELDHDERFKGRKIVQMGTGKIAQSIVFMPLKVGEEVIGVCTIQDAKPKAYTQEHLRFLEELLPYLSIALNNAIRSESLRQEIELYLKTQEELREVNRILEKISLVDGLTQIYNRRAFKVKMHDRTKEAEEKEESLSIFMIDIDNFKIYNDTYGHLEGDEVLKKVAKIVEIHLEERGGLAARFGGEEFVGACFGINLQESEVLAEKIRKMVFDLGIENRWTPLQRISVSIGLSVLEKAERSQVSELVRRADSALYEAKNTGKNKVVVKIPAAQFDR